MAGAAGFLQRVHQCGEGRRLGDAAVGHGVTNAHEFLLHDATGADVQVADLGVAHLAARQSDIVAGGVQERMRACLPQAREDWRFCLPDGVVGRFLSPAEAVEDHQHYRSGRHACLAS